VCKESVSLEERSVVGVVCILNVNRVGVVCALNVVGVVICPIEGEEGNVADLQGLVPPTNGEPTPTALSVSTGLSLPCPCPALAVVVGVGLPTGDESNDPDLDWEIHEVVICG
jgi:hypothetical protein